MFAIFALVSLARTNIGQDPTVALARQYFREASVAATADGGRLWGKSLDRPVLLIEDKTRKVYGNQPDSEGKLRDIGGIWVGDLPANLPVANFAFKWAGVRWTIIALSTVPDDLTTRLELFMHESFHGIQPELGLQIASGPCPHLNTLEGRIWIRLEGRAAAKSLLEPTPTLSQRATSDALVFRTFRQSLFAEAHERERTAELNEGLAQYTGMRLMGMPTDETRKFASRILSGWPESHPSLARWYAYDLLPIYGLTLDSLNPYWRGGLDAKSDVVSVLETAMGWKPPSNLKSAAEMAGRRYGIAEVRREEQAKENERLRRVSDLTTRFISGPVILVPLPSRTPFAFRTDKLEELPPYGTVFREIRLEDTWGVVTVGDGGILLAPDLTRGFLSAEKGPSLSTSGWSLDLRPGWSLVPGQRPGDFEIRKSQ